MSSRILSDDEQPASPVAWRRVLGASAEPAAETPDFAERMASMQQQSEQRIREAHAAGLREGEAAGRSRAAAEVQPVIERLSNTIHDLANLRPRLRREAEADLIRLALAIARRVLRRELAIDPEALHGLVLAALEKLGSQEPVRVRVHPSQAAAVAECLKRSAGGAAIEVTADGSREPGTVIFETGRGDLDASVDSQLQEIERGLVDRLRRQP